MGYGAGRGELRAAGRHVRAKHKSVKAHPGQIQVHPEVPAGTSGESAVETDSAGRKCQLPCEGGRGWRLGERAAVTEKTAAEKEALATAQALRDKQLQAFHGMELDSIQALEQLKAFSGKGGWGTMAAPQPAARGSSALLAAGGAPMRAPRERPSPDEQCAEELRAIPAAGPLCMLDGEFAFTTANTSQWSSAQTLMEWTRHDASDVSLPQVSCVQESWSSAAWWSRQWGYELIGDFAEATGDGPLEHGGEVAASSSFPASNETSPARIQLRGHCAVTAKAMRRVQKQHRELPQAALKGDDDFWRQAVLEDWLTLAHAPMHVREDQEVVLGAVQRSAGAAIGAAGPSLRRSRAFVLQALAQSAGRGLQHAAPWLQRDPLVRAKAAQEARWRAASAAPSR
ncbi:unnamed protein product [Prorocentrum cordatum]|uniref:Uncharacterized protein n=1 Tax=Prorocentrum cordatum TaxID=2364126 RepID=A0ABN9SEI2_9DINO|nr:unnamed protein product [Polarella glacialis]